MSFLLELLVFAQLKTYLTNDEYTLQYFWGMKVYLIIKHNKLFTAVLSGAELRVNDIVDLSHIPIVLIFLKLTLLYNRQKMDLSILREGKNLQVKFLTQCLAQDTTEL